MAPLPSSAIAISTSSNYHHHHHHYCPSWQELTEHILSAWHCARGRVHTVSVPHTTTPVPSFEFYRGGAGASDSQNANPRKRRHETPSPPLTPTQAAVPAARAPSLLPGPKSSNLASFWASLLTGPKALSVPLPLHPNHLVLRGDNSSSSSLHDSTLSLHRSCSRSESL